MRIPMPEPAPAPVRKPSPPARPSQELFGFDDIPAPKRLYEIEDEPVLPRRAPAPRQRWEPRERSTRASYDSSEYDTATRINLIGMACFGGAFGLSWVSNFCFGVAPGLALELDAASVVNVISGLLVLGGFFMMALSFVIALVQLVGTGEVPRVGALAAFSWVISTLLVGGFVIAMFKYGPEEYRKAAAARARRAELAAMPQNNNPPPPAFNPPQGFNPPQEFNPPIGRPQDEIRVTLNDGQVRRNTNPLGATFPGVQVQVSYNVETGRARGEKYCLMIKSRNTRAKLMTMTLRGSGNLSGTIPTASIDDGPFEAWMEAESFNGRNSRRVSETITLRMVDSAPAAQPGMNPPGVGQQPGVRPGFPGPMGPPGLNRGPRGFRGGRP